MGNQKHILKDPQFAPFLTSRSNINLKVKILLINLFNFCVLSQFRVLNFTAICLIPLHVFHFLDKW
ncbi:hypothetical protein AHAS_Ahas05G0250600 [Arachis hypogaea]